MSIPAHEVARYHANEKGYNLIGYSEVAIELLILDIEALVIEKQDLSPIDEFLLKGIDIGLNNVNDLSGAFGIERKLAERHLADCLCKSYISVIPSNIKNKSIVALTDEGQELCRTLKVKRKKIEPFQGVRFHGINRKIHLDKNRLFNSKEVERNNMQIIRAIPQSLPYQRDVVCSDLAKCERRMSYDSYSDIDVLQILKISDSKVRQYLPAVLLQYEPQGHNSTTTIIRYSFAINGELDLLLEENFAKCDGIQLLPQLKLAQPPSAEELLTTISHKFRDSLRANLKSPEDTLEIITCQPTVNSAEDVLTEEASRTQLLNKYKNAKKEITELREAVLSKGATMLIPAWDHPNILNDAFLNAKQRVIIVAAFISWVCTQSSFLRPLERCLKRGTEVTIIYGIGTDGNNRSEEKWKRGVASLKSLQAKHRKNFNLIDAGEVQRRIGEGTHEKILIKDNEYAVIGSYNWLSFKSGEKRGCGFSQRGEASFQCGDSDVINDVVNHINEQYL